MSGSWSAFWAGLEQQAVPHVRAELAKLGWKLLSTKPWTAAADHGRPLPRHLEKVVSCSPDGLIERVRAVESGVTEDSEVAR